ncbi:uncharacterized protein LOC127859298 [Dreissena polymorpha]|nr:uncharacterized protein LOC127859298 [Dreissena polymorpha]
MPSTISSTSISPSNNTTTATTTESTQSSFTPSTSLTTGNTSTSAKSDVAFADFSRGSSNAATAAGVSVAVALAVAAAVIVFVLRKKGKLCFAITKGSKLENPDNNHHISLARIESKPNAHHQSPISLGQLEAHEYSILEKDGFERHITAITSEYADVRGYFVLEKQTSDISNGNGVPVNEIHPYLVLEKQGCQPVHETPSNEINPYFVLEKQTTSNSPPINKGAALESEHDDVTMYQEIDSNDTYADIDDSRQGNNDYDYTNKTFRDSETEISGSVYNHRNATGNDYDHLGEGQSNVRAIANNYNMTSSVGMK